jgi:hypothetical protein
MSNAKFTPGPWRVEYDGSIVMNGQVVGYGLAPDGATDQEFKANTALIAAAPSLYESLVIAKDTLEVVGKHFNLSHTLATIEAALKKARGES